MSFTQRRENHHHVALQRLHRSPEAAHQQEPASCHDDVEQHLHDFESVTNGWIDYSHNHVVVKLFSHALVATSKGHEAALEKLKQDIEEQKQKSQLG